MIVEIDGIEYVRKASIPDEATESGMLEALRSLNTADKLTIAVGALKISQHALDIALGDTDPYIEEDNDLWAWQVSEALQKLGTQQPEDK